MRWLVGTCKNHREPWEMQAAQLTEISPKIYNPQCIWEETKYNRNFNLASTYKQPSRRGKCTVNPQHSPIIGNHSRWQSTAADLVAWTLSGHFLLRMTYSTRKLQAWVLSCYPENEEKIPSVLIISSKKSVRTMWLFFHTNRKYGPDWFLVRFVVL